MTIYAPSDMRAVTVSDSFGGCGQTHEAGPMAEGQRMSLDCPQCELALTSAPLKVHGWSSRQDGVALTPDERQALDSQEKEGSAATAMMVRQLGDTLAQAMRAGYAGAGVPAPAPAFQQPSAADIQSALKSMNPAELADLLKLAGLDKTAPAALETVEPPQETAPRAVKKAAAEPTA